MNDDFLNDLDELGEDLEEEVDNNGIAKEEGDVDEDEDLDLEDMLDTMAKQPGVSSVSTLRTSARFQDHMKNINSRMGTIGRSSALGPLEDDPVYQLIVASNELIVELNEDIMAVHKYVADLYSKKFPELESMVTNPLDYFNVVKEISNEMDMTLVDLANVLPSAQVMVVSVTGSTTSGQPLSPEDISRTLDGCDEGLQLNTCKEQLLVFVQERMAAIAPNVSALLGSHVAAQLMGLAGGLTALSKIPSCNIKVMGQKKDALSGFSSAATLKHQGLIYWSDIVQKTPVALRVKAMRLLSGKVTLAARVDCYQTNPTGDVGERMRGEVERRLDKLQEPPPAKTKRAMKAPDMMIKSKRGGARHRKMKERLGITDVTKEKNRISFATCDDEYGDDAMGKTFGSLGKAGSGRLRVITKDNKTIKKRKVNSGGSSGVTNGLASSLAFTPIQGIELMNPNAAADKLRAANEKYFSNSGFASVRQ